MLRIGTGLETQFNRAANQFNRTRNQRAVLAGIARALGGATDVPHIHIMENLNGIIIGSALHNYFPLIKRVSFNAGLQPRQHEKSLIIYLW